jgi:hypothetical protein
MFGVANTFQRDRKQQLEGGHGVYGSVVPPHVHLLLSAGVFALQ